MQFGFWTGWLTVMVCIDVHRRVLPAFRVLLSGCEVSYVIVCSLHERWFEDF